MSAARTTASRMRTAKGATTLSGAGTMSTTLSVGDTVHLFTPPFCVRRTCITQPHKIKQDLQHCASLLTSLSSMCQIPCYPRPPSLPDELSVFLECETLTERTPLASLQSQPLQKQQQNQQSRQRPLHRHGAPPPSVALRPALPRHERQGVAAGLQERMSEIWD